MYQKLLRVLRDHGIMQLFVALLFHSDLLFCQKVFIVGDVIFQSIIILLFAI